MLASLKMIFRRLVDNVRLDHYRFLYDEFELGSRITGLIGARGVGKTTMLLQIIKNKYQEQPVFYFSADHVYFQKITLYELIEDMHLNEGTKTFFIDEIHKYKNWNQELKNIYDGFPDIKIIFSGSSSIDLIKGSHDLSRRARLYHLPGMSFREHLNFNSHLDLPTISFNELMANHQKLDNVLLNTPKIKGYFKDYLKQGYYPFQDEDPLGYYEKILAVIDKTIYEDIANFYNLQTANLQHLKKILSFLASIPPGRTSVHNIAKNLSIDDKTVLSYLNNLSSAGLIQLLLPAESGLKGSRRPEKIFLNNTNLQYALEGKINGDVEIGTIRELFFIQNLKNAKQEIFHSKIGDYSNGNHIFEIGGKNKGSKQIKGVEKAFLVKDDILVSSKNEIPLMLFGFLY
jgi:uncharacterized protein